MARDLVLPPLSDARATKAAVFSKDTDDDLVNDAREDYHRDGSANLPQGVSRRKAEHIKQCVEQVMDQEG